MVKVSVIIPTTREDYIKKCLDSLNNQYFKDFEVLLISSKNLNIKQKNARVIIAKDKNPAYRRNLAAKHSKGDILAFIDDDVTLSRNWLSNGIKILDNNLSITGVGGPDYIPKNSSFLEKITDSLLSHKYFGSGVLAHIYYKKRKVIKRPSAIALCNFFIRKTAFNKCKGFNERVGYGGEDTELIYILQKKFNSKFLYDPSVYVYHKKRKFGLAYFKQRLRFRINNGKMVYIYPDLYIKDKKFILFFTAVTLGVILLFTNPSIFLILLLIYFLFLYLTSLNFLTKEPLIFIILPLFLFIQHIIYYIGIIIGLLNFYRYNELRKIKRF